MESFDYNGVETLQNFIKQTRTGEKPQKVRMKNRRPNYLLPIQKLLMALTFVLDVLLWVLNLCPVWKEVVRKIILSSDSHR